MNTNEYNLSSGPKFRDSPSFLNNYDEEKKKRTSKTYFVFRLNDRFVSWTSVHSKGWIAFYNLLHQFIWKFSYNHFTSKNIDYN